MRNVLTLAILSAISMLIGCSSSQVNEAKISFAEESGRAVEGAFVSVSEKKLSAEEFEAKSCASEASYYREKVEEDLKDKFDVQEKEVIVSRKSLAGTACRAVLPVFLDFAIDEADLKPCARAIGMSEIMKVGDLACDFLQEKTE